MSLDLTPQIKGRLAKQERAVIDILNGTDAAENTFRTSVSIKPCVALAALRAAEAEHRDFSNFVTVALQEFVARHGAPASDTVELLAEIGVAAEQHPELLGDIRRLLHATVRAARSA